MDLEYRETEIVYEIKYVCDGQMRIVDAMPDVLTHVIDDLLKQNVLLVSVRIMD